MLSRFLILLALSMQSEVEPNGSFARATPTGTLPAPHPVECYGTVSRGDRDFWKIHLDYHTNWYCEGAAHFKVSCSGPVTLAVFDKDWAGGYRLVGRWSSATGSINTGEIPLEYWWNGHDTAMAVVIGQGEYTLSYW